MLYVNIELIMKMVYKLVMFIPVIFLIMMCSLNAFHSEGPQSPNYRKVSCGYWHSLAIDESGSVFAWGANWYGQLGNEATKQSSIPKRVEGLNSVVDISCGACHNLALKTDGTVWAWGANSFAQLSDGIKMSRSKPSKIKGLENITSIACGESCSLALRKDGTVWSWGYNHKGQLGNGTISDSVYPKQINGLNNIKQIAANRSTSIALTKDGSIWVWGSNKNGLLCNDRFAFMPVPIKIDNLNNIISIACGGTHILALSKDGFIWAWGSNGNGQLGTGDTVNCTSPKKVKLLKNIKDISCGDSYSLALKSDGSVWAWGGGASLGNATTKASAIPIRLSQLPKIKFLSSAYNHNLVITNDNKIWAWGSNWMGQLGNGTTNDCMTPVEIKDNNFIAVNINYENSIQTHTNLDIMYNGKSLNNTTYKIEVANINNPLSNEYYDINEADLPKDGMFIDQWGMFNYGQAIDRQTSRVGVDINILPAWRINTGVKTVLVGILDTGIDINHQDLNENVFCNKNEIPNNNIDDDNNGFIDDVNGWDFSNNDNTVFDSSSTDLHGTSIAGVIAASNNEKGIVGVAPNIKIVPLKFIDGDIGSTFDAIKAIEYADKLGIKIINCSWGWSGSNYNEILKSIMDSKGILFVCASGNKLPQDVNIEFYPACFNINNILSVAAINSQGILDPNSNYGKMIDIAAPGVGILSTIPNNKYGLFGGSSISTAFLTGIAALIESESKYLSINEIKSIIMSNIKHLPEINGKVKCNGIPDAYSALKSLN